jgi:translation initiation factor IF-1
MAQSKKDNASQKEIKVRVAGTVIQTGQNTKYLIEIDVQGIKHKLIGYISGRMRQNYIKVAEGDKVVVEVSPYDLSIGRIVYNAKKDPARLAAQLAVRETEPEDKEV